MLESRNEPHLQEKNYEELHAIMTVADVTISKKTGGIRYMWRAYGKPEKHQKAMSTLADDSSVQEFHVV